MTRGGTGQLSLGLQNLGTAAAQGSARVRLIASLDGALSPDDTTLADLMTRVSLKPGKSKAAKLRLTVPSDLAAGVYTLFAVIERAGLGDGNGANDTAQVPVQVR